MGGLISIFISAGTNMTYLPRRLYEPFSDSTRSVWRSSFSRLHKTLFPPYTLLDLICGRFIPGLFTLTLISFWKGQRDTAAAGFNSDHRMEDFRLNDLLCRSNRKCDLDLVFNLYGPSSNLYRCDSESGLF